MLPECSRLDVRQLTPEGVPSSRLYCLQSPLLCNYESVLTWIYAFLVVFFFFFTQIIERERGNTACCFQRKKNEVRKGGQAGTHMSLRMEPVAAALWMYPGFRAWICARKAFSDVGDGTRSSKWVRPNSESTLLSVSLPTSVKQKLPFNFHRSILAYFFKHFFAFPTKNATFSQWINHVILLIISKAYSFLLVMGPNTEAFAYLSYLMVILQTAFYNRSCMTMLNLISKEWNLPPCGITDKSFHCIQQLYIHGFENCWVPKAVI